MDVSDEVIAEGLTMVTKERFDTISRNFDLINNLEGDIVECGIWKGGMGIFLSDLFDDKNIWLCDSFNGFQDIAWAKYQYYKNEPHNPDFNSEIRVGLDKVIENFKTHGLEDDRIKFVNGWVRDTLPRMEIDKISLLRIDVDAYSATREVLDALYEMVVDGGFIIFDDSCLIETADAIFDFFVDKKINLRHPETDEMLDIKDRYGLPCGCYLIK